MNSEISVFAPAKINLFLEITGKRTDGYHDIATLFAKLAIGDNIKISVEKADAVSIEIKVKGPFAQGVKADKTNLAWKAAAAFFEYFGIKAKCAIRLEKNIPTGSGLGGGSSDAAAVLMALCTLFKIETNAKRMKDLVKIAAKIGADVPSFLYEDTFFKAEGIGDILAPVKNQIKSPWIIVAYPGVPSSTKEAYERLKVGAKEKILTNLSSLNKLISAIEGGGTMKDWKPCVYNRMEEGVFKYIKPCAELKADMIKNGADCAAMSGSGSCVFAFVDDKAKAEEIAGKIRKDDRIVFLTHFWRTKV